MVVLSKTLDHLGCFSGMFKVFQWSCSFLGLRFILRNKQYLDSDKAFIIIANHQSAVDVLGKPFVLCFSCSEILTCSDNSFLFLRH